MNVFNLILRTLKHYRWSNLAASSGIAVATAVICGALIVGNSLRQSLLHLVELRLGSTTHSLTSGERTFSASLAERLETQSGDAALTKRLEASKGISTSAERVEAKSGIAATAVLKSSAVVAVEGSNLSLDRVQIMGIDSRFTRLAGKGEALKLGMGEACISREIANRLNAHPGDVLQLQIRQVGPIPSNTPFVAEDKQIVMQSVVIKAIAPDSSYGRFNLRNGQGTPLNVFVSIDWLNAVMGSNQAANLLLIDGQSQTHFGATVTEAALQAAVRMACTLADYNLLLRPTGGGKQVLTSERVFMDDRCSKPLVAQSNDASEYLTYFVNGLAFRNRVAPYSFVTAVGKSRLHNGLQALSKPDDIVINDWLATDLGIQTGDSLTLTYYTFGTLRSLVERSHRFRVTGILPMRLSVQDSLLMPYLPGLSDAGNCRDWKTGIPLQFKRIRDKDEAYWTQFKGTPKAYILLETGEQLWQNSFGNRTTVVFDSVPSPQLISPFEVDFKLSAVREEGLESALHSVDFSQLFAGLGMFILIAGLLLTALLFNLSFKRRELQIRLYVLLGFSIKRIRLLVFSEILGMALVGSLAGILLSVGYSKLVFWGLHKVWFDIVRTDMLQLYLEPWQLLVGMLMGLCCGVMVVYANIQKTLKRYNAREMGLQLRQKKRRNGRLMPFIVFGITVMLTLGLCLLGMWQNAMVWFSAGLLWLISGLLLVRLFLQKQSPAKAGLPSLHALVLRNLRRLPAAGFTVVAVLAMGTFVLVMTAANKKDKLEDSTLKTCGTGGFSFVAETTIPFLRNLNDAGVRAEYGLPENIRIVPFVSAYDDDASCLNLNRIANPRILAGSMENLDGRFRFVSVSEWMDKHHPWLSLNRPVNGMIPVVADQTVLEWGMGKKVGDTLTYVNHRGERIKMLIVGGLESSVFQGNLLMSTTLFRQHFRENGGTDFMLIEAANTHETSSLIEDLNNAFREYGWVTTTTRDRLAEFGSIENTYLSIFFLMGAFALLLGTIGLAVRIIVGLLERRKEIAILRTLGFRKQILVRIFAFEYLTLFFAGTLLGVFAAMVATLPSLLSGNQTVSPGFIAWVLAILILNGLLWIVLTPVILVGRSSITDSLRND